MLARIGALRLVWANAGIGHLGGLVSGPPSGFDWIYGVNVLGAIHTLRAFLPALVAADGARHVGLTASVAGLLPAAARTPAYAASKHAVVGLGECLRAELAPLGIGVTIACPGLVATEIWDGARVRPPRFGGPFAAPREVGERHRTQGLSPEWVVDRIWEQVERGGGYVSPVTGADVAAEFDRRSAELRATSRPRSSYRSGLNDRSSRPRRIGVRIALLVELSSVPSHAAPRTQASACASSPSSKKRTGTPSAAAP